MISFLCGKSKNNSYKWIYIVALVESLSHVQLFVTPWTVARRTPLSSTVSQSLLKFTSIKSVMLANLLILYHLLLLLPSVFPSIRVSSNECIWIQNRNRLTDIENTLMLTKGEREEGRDKLKTIELTDISCYVQNR